MRTPEGIPEHFERFRLLPTRGMSDGSCWAYASDKDSRELLDFAKEFSHGLSKPVMVIRQPVDGMPTPLYTVGLEYADPKKGRVR